jgi:RNA polymerase sigma-70 factor (ECF subfamily)
LGDQPGGDDLVARIRGLLARPHPARSAWTAAEGAAAAEGSAAAPEPSLELPAAFDVRNELHLDLAAGCLLRRFREADDAEAFTALVELTRPPLHHIARQVARQLAMALDPEDLVATFFARLFTDVRKQQPLVRRFLGLARTSMRNDALNQLRQFKRAQARHAIWGRQGLFDKWADPAAQADDREQVAVLRRLGTVFLCVVNQCFHELPERDRRVLLAREMDGLSYDEIAEALGLPRAQVGMILKRARQHLSDRIGECFARPGRARRARRAREHRLQQRIQWPAADPRAASQEVP